MKRNKAQQSATKNNVIDFKEFFSATRRNMTASEKAQQNPSPPKGGEGFCCARAVAVLFRSNGYAKSEMPELKFKSER